MWYIFGKMGSSDGKILLFSYDYTVLNETAHSFQN